VDDNKIRKINDSIQLDGDDPIIDADLIEAVEELLELAKKGDVTEVAYVAHHNDFTVSHHFVGDAGNASAMIGELDVLKDNYKTIRHPNILFRTIEEE
jgi:hypothetical protein